MFIYQHDSDEQQHFYKKKRQKKGQQGTYPDA